MNIYFDIDGVILANDKQPALHVKEFLRYFIERYPTYWLTTHCKEGDANNTVSYIKSCMDKETLELVKKIKPTKWTYSKTEAIDFSTPFIWFDDYIYESERQELTKRNCLNSWIKVDLSQNVDHLKDILDLFLTLNKE